MNAARCFTLTERLRQYALLVRLHRPIGIFLLLWPTLWALWLAAGGPPGWHIGTVFVLGVVLMRSAGCAINDYADRDFDREVARTRERPLAAGRIQPVEALAVAGVLALMALALVLTLNPLTLALAFVAAALAALYPYTKRFLPLPQAVLGLAFGWSIPMAYAAVTGAVPAEAWWLFAANLAWTLAYDTLYAMADRADDERIGVRSAAILFGRADRLAIGLFQVLALLLLVAVGARRDFGLAYAAGLAVATGLAVYQQRLLRARAPADCIRAFLNNNYFGLAVFAGLALEFA